MPWPLIVGLIVFIAFFSGTYAMKPIGLGRSIRSVLLLCVAAFCVFGFLASFEVPGITWKLAYATLGSTALAGATLPWLISKRGKVASPPVQ